MKSRLYSATEYAHMICEVCLKQIRRCYTERSEQMPAHHQTLVSHIEGVKEDVEYTYLPQAQVAIEAAIVYFNQIRRLGEPLPEPFLFQLLAIWEAICTAISNPKDTYTEDGYSCSGDRDESVLVGNPNPEPEEDWLRPKCAHDMAQGLLQILKRMEDPRVPLLCRLTHHINASSRIHFGYDNLTQGLKALLRHCSDLLLQPEPNFRLALELCNRAEVYATIRIQFDPLNGSNWQLIGDIGCLREAVEEAQKDPQGTRVS